jgi:hypothetical protein
LARRVLAYLLVLAAGVFAAWQVRVFWTGSRGPAAPPAVGVRGPTGARAQPAWRVPSDPAEMTAEALAASGLGRLAGHPGGLAPPHGTEAAWAFQQRPPGRVDELAQYHYSGEPGDAVDYYQRSLTERGFRLAWDRTDAAGRRQLQFHKGLSVANLTLQRPPRQAKLVVLTLIVSRPATPPAADE